MEACDVLIVGGGPAGSSCAWGLRRSGLDVLLLDKRTFPRDKVCGGWITPRVLHSLGISPLQYSRYNLLQPMTGFRVGQMDGPAIETSYGAPVSYGIRRCEFDEYLLSRTRVRVALGVGLSSLERSGGAWLVNESIRARVVVGAGGHFCPVAALVGGKKPDETPVVAQETEFEMDGTQADACRVQGEMPELYFCRDMKGYGWCIRKGNFLNVGLGRTDPHRLSTHVAGFIRFLNESGRVPFSVPTPRGHAYLLRGTSPRTVVDDGLLLIGDSAGLAHPQSGEGIGPAVASGLAAAKAIRSARRNYEREKLTSYTEYLNANPPAWAARAGRLLPSGLSALAARVLLRQPWFVRHVVLDGWFLHPAGSARS